MPDEERSPSEAALTPGLFATTRWTLVLQARGSHPEAEAALSQLCQTYWGPLYSYLRRDGHRPDDAADLVQAFFERFLAKDYLREVAREKGRFRSFLLASLRHFVFNEHRAGKRLRRGGTQHRISIDCEEEEAGCRLEIASAHTPEQSYDRRWAQKIMETALIRLEQEMAAAGKQAQFDVLQPWIAAEPVPGDYEAAAPKLGFSPKTVAVVVYRLRQRFRDVVRAEVANTVAVQDDIDEEMRYLLEVISAN